jgi:hypothetical protein
MRDSVILRTSNGLPENAKMTLKVIRYSQPRGKSTPNALSLPVRKGAFPPLSTCTFLPPCRCVKKAPHCGGACRSLPHIVPGLSGYCAQTTSAA